MLVGSQCPHGCQWGHSGVVVSPWLSVGSQCPHGCQWGHSGVMMSPWLSVGSQWGCGAPMAVSGITVPPWLSVGSQWGCGASMAVSVVTVSPWLSVGSQWGRGVPTPPPTALPPAQAQAVGRARGLVGRGLKIVLWGEEEEEEEEEEGQRGIPQRRFLSPSPLPDHSCWLLGKAGSHGGTVGGEGGLRWVLWGGRGQA